MKPISCDTFVCLPPNTLGGHVIFGKNSDRPEGEVQEIIYQPKINYDHDDVLLKCTYIEIEQVRETFAVILSKPSWMWGAEMGANEFGVVIGNEAVWTKLMDSKLDLKERLLGMDLVRLGLERGKTAKDALNVLTQLLAKYGQGGPCSDSMKSWSYHNSFLIADAKEAWVLETAGNEHWAAENVQIGYRNISNELSIGTKIDLCSPGLKEEALKLGFWNGIEPFHFAKAFSDDFSENCGGRYYQGKKLLEKYSANKDFNVKSMMKILRDEPSGICMGYDDSFPSASSQVSLLRDDGQPNHHWMTGTPDPQHSIFKPFTFGTLNISLTDKINVKEDKRKNVKVDRRHELFKAHETFYRKTHSRNVTSETQERIAKSQREIENRLIEIVEGATNSNANENLIFNSAVEEEMQFYKTVTQDLSKK